jgi:type I restriction enzyme S subunit
LTRDWRLNHDSPDLKINHDLKEEKSRKSSNHENQGSDIPPSWREVKLETLLKVDPQNGLYKPQEFYGRGSLIVRIDNFYDGVLAPWEKLRRLELDAQEQERYRLEENDILVNRVNSIDFLGKSALVRNVQELCVFESNMMRLQFALDSTNPEYIIIYLNSIKGTTELRKNAKHAVNQASINQKDVKDVLINLPLLEEQTEIVKRVEELFAIADKIEERYKKAKKQVDKVQLSLLAKAFRGELVPQNPNDKPIALPLSPLSRGNSKKE